ncbi:hypothetical protein DFH07DRAFT_802587 [Mycena maculata]|uniref:Uncharacterized protein n=1 Tax=Mycena maculata TaxID=230809 RepID=A0AAD7JVC0_9AGAR|nr:hypothetical protein DFH07DRAFT_802587 [Mycena maculata]
MWRSPLVRLFFSPFTHSLTRSSRPSRPAIRRYGTALRLARHVLKTFTDALFSLSQSAPHRADASKVLAAIPTLYLHSSPSHPLTLSTYLLYRLYTANVSYYTSVLDLTYLIVSLTFTAMCLSTRLHN